jgi:hypothetical protein
MDAGWKLMCFFYIFFSYWTPRHNHYHLLAMFDLSKWQSGRQRDVLSAQSAAILQAATLAITAPSPILYGLDAKTT